MRLQGKTAPVTGGGSTEIDGGFDAAAFALQFNQFSSADDPDRPRHG